MSTNMDKDRGKCSQARRPQMRKYQILTHVISSLAIEYKKDGSGMRRIGPESWEVAEAYCEFAFTLKRSLGPSFVRIDAPSLFKPAQIYSNSCCHLVHVADGQVEI